MFRWFVVLGVNTCIVICTLVNACVAADPKPGDFGNERLVSSNNERHYRMVVPRTVDLRSPAPLVIALHGIAVDSKDLMFRYTNLAATAEKHGFLLCFPDAMDKRWGLGPDRVRQDLKFFDDLLAKLKAEYQIDTHRIYVVGMSNGGYFAQVIGRERSTVVAAVASHSGPLGLETLAGINAVRKFPVMIVHGTQDRVFRSETFRENRDKYKKEGHEVKFIEVKGLGHRWATEVDINESIWEFFATHPLGKI